MFRHASPAIYGICVKLVIPKLCLRKLRIPCDQFRRQIFADEMKAVHVILFHPVMQHLGNEHWIDLFWKIELEHRFHSCLVKGPDHLLAFRHGIQERIIRFGCKIISLCVAPIIQPLFFLCS